MHFAKTYTQLLLSLPPELRENAIEYRKLKKLINNVVSELQDLGYPPDKLHQVLLESKSAQDPSGKGKAKESDAAWVPISSKEDNTGYPRVVYEIKADSDRLEPRLRLLVNSSDTHTAELPLQSIAALENAELHSLDSPPETPPEPAEEQAAAASGLASTSASVQDGEQDSDPVVHISTQSNQPHEIIIPLASDTRFFEVLMQALQALGTQLGAVSDEFMENLSMLAKEVAATARPVSATSSSFQPHSKATNPALVTVQGPGLIHRGSKSDLYQWREIFQLYVDTEVFESQGERTRGERSIEEAEARLELFKNRLSERGYSTGHALKLKQSAHALQTFLDLNAFILDLKKFQYATTEATRKILKKHAKRTALPVSPSLTQRFSLPAGALVTHASSAAAAHALVPNARAGTSLAVMLVQALGETLLPIVPHIDDYACVICTAIAFKPIRLRCGHLFCVRCLVKMQKRGKGDCPMCRAPTVLAADRSNVDWALLNFMKDWFPIEAREKLQQNEKEATEEHLQEMGFDPEQGCIIA
ncbi:SPX domain-containing protein [Phanerochaete sordida]|uniref:SPX domain-containing protein n=1 Tax=Phanerochaete sordida TaxID=48140 RepID=A0A9P3G3L5_9APHY|nr:SPX domain-containing protein [Phanerochaete sordida]